MPSREPGSYRDPSGFVFYDGPHVYRYIRAPDFPFFAQLVEGHAFRALVSGGNDLASVDQLYRSCRESGSRVLPLCVDIANPSPPAGWENLERKSFLERMEGKFDCVSTLALIHHLLITRRVPLEFVVRLQSRLSRKFLLTEFVSRQDSKFKQLLLHRTDDFDYYTEDFFQTVHGKFFRIIRELELKDPSRGLDRKLFLMEKI